MNSPSWRAPMMPTPQRSILPSPSVSRVSFLAYSRNWAHVVGGLPGARTTSRKVGVLYRRFGLGLGDEDRLLVAVPAVVAHHLDAGVGGVERPLELLERLDPGGLPLVPGLEPDLGLGVRRPGREEDDPSGQDRPRRARPPPPRPAPPPAH